MALCSKPSCRASGAFVLTYDYASRRATLADRHSPSEMPPHLYVLCSSCADRLIPPRGWELVDLRGERTAVDVSALAERRSSEDDLETTRVAFGHGA